MRMHKNEKRFATRRAGTAKPHILPISAECGLLDGANEVARPGGAVGHEAQVFRSYPRTGTCGIADQSSSCLLENTGGKEIARTEERGDVLVGG